eukprot:CAMPEP_0203683844 /NCGR_PEP_ID=MMETSP0090-20130426/47730_1 /ASSEMBLY_ACC=CAM_ASM_001088 /TAXON_ID=426623 /ORGANISM="Chaetoceros affinis, Strain CCMP159" /LENGTH=365 /DNA_ID=CAMNT_0050552999 /DNA_START=1654 /DNA_END=2751 /DNA_ORIENTATION=-
MIRRFTKQPTEDEIPKQRRKNNNFDDEKSPKQQALKHLFCGGVAGSVAKTVTAPLSRLTILFQVHSLVATKENRLKFAMRYGKGLRKIIERGGILSLWKGNGTSVLHRFPFSAINFYVYENMLSLLHERQKEAKAAKAAAIASLKDDSRSDNIHDYENDPASAYIRMVSGAVAGCTACVACYPLDLIRTRLTTELPGKEHYKGIADAFTKIIQTEGPSGLYAGLGPTLFVAVPNFAISYTIYGSLKEYVLEDKLFYNLRKVDVNGEESLGFRLSLLCGAASGSLSTLVTFPFDTVRRRMQIQNLHIDEKNRLNGFQQINVLLRNEGVDGLYRGLPPELLKVIPMVGTMFTVYEFLKQQLNIKSQR